MRYLFVFLFVLILTACIATEDGFIMRTADPSWGVKITYPTPVEVQSEDPELAATPSCEMIKGNISADGRKLYHVPGMPNYNQTEINESKGERFFCTTAEAEEAGWVKAGG